MSKSYDINVVRDGKWWMVEIPAVDGLTQARRLGEVKEMAREYIALVREVPMSDVDVIVRVVKVDGKDYAKSKADLAAAREAQAKADALAGNLARDLAHELAAEKVPVRDIGELLDVSFQRAQQLVKH